MKSRFLPEAVVRAQVMIWHATGLGIVDHRIRFELATAPDQYRVSWLSLDDEFAYRALVPHITLAPEQFAAWQNWLDAPEGERP